MSEKPPNSCDKPPPYVDIPLSPIALQPEELVIKSDDSLGLKEKKTEDPTIARDSMRMEKSTGTTVREFVMHFFFLVIICVIAFPTHWSASHRLTSAADNVFIKALAPSDKKLADINGIDDVWEYMENQLMDGLYLESPVQFNSHMEPHFFSRFFEDKVMINHCRLLGQPRIRMLKSTASSCMEIHKLARMPGPCYSRYTKKNEDTNPINRVDLQAFKYMPAEKLYNNDLSGVLTRFREGYGGGGFVQYLSETNETETRESIAQLKKHRWIDGATRLVVVDFAAYNGQMNLFCIVKLMFEFPSTGEFQWRSVIPTARIDTLRLIRYVTNYDKFVLVFEGIFCALLMYAIIEEFFDICRFIHLRSYSYLTFWKFVDLAIVGLSIACVYLSVHRTKIARPLIKDVMEDGQMSYSFDTVVKAENSYSFYLALLVFFTFLKTFKYIFIILDKLLANITRPARLIEMSYSERSKRIQEIGIFAMMFFMCLMSYLQFGYLIYINEIQDNRGHQMPS